MGSPPAISAGSTPPRPSPRSLAQSFTISLLCPRGSLCMPVIPRLQSALQPAAPPSSTSFVLPSPRPTRPRKFASRKPAHPRVIRFTDFDAVSPRRHGLAAILSDLLYLGGSSWCQRYVRRGDVAFYTLLFKRTL